MSSNPTVITWTSLLTHWTAIARATLALPAGSDGDRWRAAVPEIISLQAVTHALADLDRTSDPAERAVGQDKAEILIRGSAARLHAMWRSEVLPSELTAMIKEARAALSLTKLSGLEWRLTVDANGSSAHSFDHPSDLIATLLSNGFEGDVFVPAPGIVFMAGSPVAFVRGRHGGSPTETVISAVNKHLEQGVRIEAVRQPCFRQVYRQIDFGTGRIVRDLVVPETSELAAGQPLLVPAIARGRELPVPMPPPPGAIDRVACVAVVFSDSMN